jgi:hypothetical protein
VSRGKPRTEILNHSLARSEFANFDIFVGTMGAADITWTANDRLDTGPLI